MKTLEKFLEELDKGITVSIGASSGSGYVYIGKPDEQKIREAFDKYRDNQVMIGARSKNALLALIPKQLELTGNKEEDEEILIGRASKIAGYYASVKGSDSYLKNYKDPMQRAIQEQYERLHEEEGLILVISGTEKGEFWRLEDVK